MEDQSQSRRTNILVGDEILKQIAESPYITHTNGVMTINEWRAKKDLKPIEGGDEVFISCNVAPIGSDKINGNSASVAKSQSNNRKIKGE